MMNAKKTFQTAKMMISKNTSQLQEWVFVNNQTFQKLKFHLLMLLMKITIQMNSIIQSWVSCREQKKSWDKLKIRAVYCLRRGMICNWCVDKLQKELCVDKIWANMFTALEIIDLITLMNPMLQILIGKVNRRIITMVDNRLRWRNIN